MAKQKAARTNAIAKAETAAAAFVNSLTNLGEKTGEVDTVMNEDPDGLSMEGEVKTNDSISDTDLLHSVAQNSFKSNCDAGVESDLLSVCLKVQETAEWVVSPSSAFLPNVPPELDLIFGEGS